MRGQTGSSLRPRRRALSAVFLAVVALLLVGGSVLAAFVSDDGNLFSASARSSAETKISQIQRDTGKTIAVKTVPNLGGKDVSTAADQYFSQQNLNGVLIFAARDEKKLALKVGVNTRPAVTTAEETAIRDQLTSQFAAGKFDDGLLGAIDRIGNDFRAATPARTGSSQPATAPVAARQQSGVSPFVVILAIIVIVALIALVFAVFRRNSGSTWADRAAGTAPTTARRVAATALATVRATGSRAAGVATSRGASSEAPRAASAARSLAMRSTITSAIVTVTR